MSNTAKKKCSMTYVAFQHISLHDGADLVAELLRQRERVAAVTDNKVEYWKALKKTSVSVFGERVRMNARLIEMASFSRLDTCAGCGCQIDGFFIGYNHACGPTESLERGVFSLVPVIQGRLVTCDHIIPQTLGGRDTGQNMQTMCVTCNSNKGHLISDEDLALVDDVEMCISASGLYQAARAVTKEYRSAKYAVTTTKNAKRQMTSRFTKAEDNLVNLRKLITFTSSRGMSMIPQRQLEIERSIANRQLIPV